MLTFGPRGQSGPGAIQLTRAIKEPAMFIGLVIVIAVLAAYMMLRRRRRP